MHELAAVLSLEGNLNKETMICLLQQRERQRSAARKIRFLRGKLSTGSTTLVTIQDEQGHWIDLTSKHEIEKAIVQNNSEKFRQSFHTPFMVPPLKHLFGFKGLTSNAQAVLTGVHELPDHLVPSVLDLLNELRTPDSIRDLGKRSVDLTMASYQAFWKRAKVNTSWYPGALSFATLQAGASDNLICDFECSMTRIPLKAGYSPIRWRKMLDVMILKRAGHTNVVQFENDCSLPT